MYLSLSLQQGGGPLGGDFDYVRVLPDVRGYHSFGDDDELTLAARLRVGRAVAVLRATPTTARWSRASTRAAAISMRGFADRRLSPLLLVPPPPGAPNDPGHGADRRQRPDRRQLRGALLADADAARWRRSSTSARSRAGGSTPATSRTCSGRSASGIRYLTPIGPIRVDLARRLPFGDLPPLYRVDAATGAIVQVPYVAERQLLRAVRLERDDAGARQHVRAPHRDRGGVLMRTRREGAAHRRRRRRWWCWRRSRCSSASPGPSCRPVGAASWSGASRCRG